MTDVQFPLADGSFYRCQRTERVCASLEGDDKIWCAACQTTHYPHEMTKLSKAELSACLKKGTP